MAETFEGPWPLEEALPPLTRDEGRTPSPIPLCFVLFSRGLHEPVRVCVVSFYFWECIFCTGMWEGFNDVSGRCLCTILAQGSSGREFLSQVDTCFPPSQKNGFNPSSEG